jgi:hypothetical protein
MGVSSTEFTPRPFWTWALRGMLCLLPLAVVFVSGCNPASLAMLLVPFMDDKEPAKCKISTPNKETTVAIVTWFGNAELKMWPELVPADSELSERLAAILRDRYALNKEKVKIVPNAQVRNYQNKMVGDTWSPAEIGKQVKADKVIALEINSLSLYEKSTQRSQQLFRGNTEIAVKVYDLDKPAGEQVVFEDFYKRVFPRENPIDGGGSSMQFRATFITRAARELSKLFAAYASDERMHDMETD